MMTKIEGIILLLEDARTDRNSFASYNRVHRACHAIGLTNGESEQILDYLEYHDGYGRPCGWLQEKINEAEAKKAKKPEVKPC